MAIMPLRGWLRLGTHMSFPFLPASLSGFDPHLQEILARYGHHPLAQRPQQSAMAASVDQAAAVTRPPANPGQHHCF